MSMLDKAIRELPGNGNGKGNGHGSLESLLEELETDPRVAELAERSSRYLGTMSSCRSGCVGSDRASGERTERIPAVVSRAAGLARFRIPRLFTATRMM